MAKLPVYSTYQELDYNELGWKLFEHLCKRLVIMSEPQASETRLYLRDGYEQHGIDGYAYDPHDGKYVTFQCKCYKKFNAKNVREAVDTFLAGDFVDKSKKFILCVTAHIDGHYESEIAQQRERLREKGVQFISWDQAGLDNRLKNEPQLVYEFFDGCKEYNWVRAFCGDDKVQLLKKPVELRDYPAPAAFVERLLTLERQPEINNTNQVSAQTLTSILLERSLAVPCRLFLRSDAGIGKSTELAYAAHFFADSKGSLLFPILLPLKNYIDEHLPTWLDRRQSNWDQVPESKLLLLVDGLDEVKSEEREKFIRRLHSFLDEHPASHVVLSCRTNFSNNKLQFNDFLTYDLSEFDQADIKTYVQQVLNEEELTLFWELLDDDSLLQWLKNPFSLIQFVNLFKISPHTVPKTRVGLLKKVVELRLKEDLIHNRAVDAAPTYYRLLKRMAFVMNRLGVNSLSDYEWRLTIPNDDEREQCRQLSLLKVGEERVSFEHNILQEYFSALVLADQTFDIAVSNITFRPNHDRIKPKWFNTIGLWLEALEENSSQLAQLLQLVSEQEPHLLLTIEYQHFSNDLRLKAFQTVLKQSTRVARHRLHYDERLSEFANIGGNSAVIAFLLEQIADSEQEISNECLYYLSRASKDDLFGYEPEIYQLLEYEVAQDNPFRQELAIEVAVNLQLSNNRITQLVTGEMPNLNRVRIRDDVYSYLQQTSQVETYIDFLLTGIDVYQDYLKHKSTTYVGTGWNLLNLLGNLHETTSLHRLLDYLIDRAEHLDDTDSLFRHDRINDEQFFRKFSKRLSVAYLADNSLYDKVTSLYRRLTKYYAEVFAEELSLFFELTDTQEPIFWLLLQSESIWQYDRLIGKVANERTLEKSLDLHSKGMMTSDQMRCIIHGLYMDKRPVMAENLAIAATQVGHYDFNQSSGIDYAAIRNQRKQNDYDLLDNQPLFIAKVEEVFNYYESDKISIDKLYKYRRSGEELDNEVVTDLMSRFDRKKETIYRQEIVDWLKDSVNWEPYVRGELLSRLEHKQALPIPQYHLDQINQWCQAKISEANFWESISQKMTNNGLTTTQRCLEWRLSEFYRLTDIKLPDQVLLTMLGTELFGLRWDGREGIPSLSGKIIEQINDNIAVANQLIANLEKPFNAARVWLNHFELCHQLNLKDAVPHLKQALQNTDRFSDYDHSRLLRYYLELGGELSKLTFIFSEFKPTSDFSWELLGKFAEAPNYKKRVSDFLIKRLSDDQLDKHDLRLSKQLVLAGSIVGLQLYSEWIKANGKMPETHDRLEGIKDLPAQDAAKIYLDLITFKFEHSISNDRFNEPLDVFIEALKEIVLSKESIYQQVKKRLITIQNLYAEHPDHFAFQRNVARLEQEYYLQKIDYSSIKEALEDLSTYSI